MTVPTMPAAIVAAPARTPLPFGLFSVVTFRDDGTDRWAAGVEMEDLIGCGPLTGVGHGGYCADPEDVTGLPLEFDQSGAGFAAASPFTIVGHHKCSPVGNAGPSVAEARLLTFEERAVEHAFATGLLGNTPTLRGATALTSAPVPAKTAVGLLEEWSATEYGTQGVIHAPRSVPATDFRQAGLAYRTPLGTPTVFGSGYDGSGPDGEPAPAGARWIYITPPLAAYRSVVETHQLFDPSVNDLIAYAQRDYLIGMNDCGVAAALVILDAADGAITVPARTGNPYLT